MRDAEIAKMRAGGVPFRTIAERLGMSLGAVQNADRRARKLADAASGELAAVVALVDDELTADDVTCPADVERLNILELYRLGFVPDLPADVQAAKVTAWAAPTPLGCLPFSSDTATTRSP
jgi:hypothetical protein